MRTHHRLILSIIATTIGIGLIFIGSFEPADLFRAFDIPRSTGKYMAFGGMGMTGLGSWELFNLLQPTLTHPTTKTA